MLFSILPSPSKMILLYHISSYFSSRFAHICKEARNECFRLLPYQICSCICIPPFRTMIIELSFITRISQNVLLQPKALHIQKDAFSKLFWYADSFSTFFRKYARPYFPLRILYLLRL